MKSNKLLTTLQSNAFTLIELLIVVAIIAILAAIAVPNFLEAQVRSKVTRVKSDHRTFATAIEIYQVDNNRYPSVFTSISDLTTPIPYLTSSTIVDPFGVKFDPNYPGPLYGYANLREGIFIAGFISPVATSPASLEQIKDNRWMITGRGPDTLLEVLDENAGNAITFVSGRRFFTKMQAGTLLYDSTNGTVSVGDIVRTGKGILGEGTLY